MTNLINPMPPKGELFRGEINDLFDYDARVWRRRDITFFKRGITTQIIYGYPKACSPGNKIYIKLIDQTYKTVHICKFSKPETSDCVCLGEPSHLKTWYINHKYAYSNVATVQKNGFKDKVAFEYTGNDFEFIIYSNNAFTKKYPNIIL